MSVNQTREHRAAFQIQHLRLRPSLRLQNYAVRSHCGNLSRLDSHRLLHRKLLVDSHNLPVVQDQIGVSALRESTQKEKSWKRTNHSLSYTTEPVRSRICIVP